MKGRDNRDVMYIDIVKQSVLPHYNVNQPNSNQSNLTLLF